MVTKHLPKANRGSWAGPLSYLPSPPLWHPRGCLLPSVRTLSVSESPFYGRSQQFWTAPIVTRCFATLGWHLPSGLSLIYSFQPLESLWRSLLSSRDGNRSASKLWSRVHEVFSPFSPLDFRHHFILLKLHSTLLFHFVGSHLSLLSQWPVVQPLQGQEHQLWN